jgi:hypothetical protein
MTPFACAMISILAVLGWGLVAFLAYVLHRYNWTREDLPWTVGNRRLYSYTLDQDTWAVRSPDKTEQDELLDDEALEKIEQDEA